MEEMGKLGWWLQYHGGILVCGGEGKRVKRVVFDRYLTRVKGLTLVYYLGALVGW